MSSFKESKLKPVLSVFFISDTTKGLAETRARLPCPTSIALNEGRGLGSQLSRWETQENFPPLTKAWGESKMKAFMVVEGKRKQLYVDSKQLTKQRNGH